MKVFKRNVDRFIVRIFGYEEVIVKSCAHKSLCLACERGKGDYAYCEGCGLRTPSLPHDNLAWAETIFKDAAKSGKLFRDVGHLEKMYSCNLTTGEVSKKGFLYYHYEEEG